MERELDARDATPVDGVTMDIGVSSMQLDQAERGFSFQADGPLDMRMSQAGESAADFVNTADEERDRRRALSIWRGAQVAPRRARDRRGAAADARPASSRRVVRKALGHKPHDKKDPATRTFQAIRIHINRELGELADGLAAAERVLKPGGRLAVVTFHSSRTGWSSASCASAAGRRPAGSRHLPQAAARRQPSFETVGRAVRAGEAEIARNPRARSATLRAARRTAAAPWAVRGAMMMVAYRFRRVWLVRALRGAWSLGCYLVSLAGRGRAQEARPTVERAIASAQRDIRALETEFDTRANLAQLERWNGDTLALSAPTAGAVSSATTAQLADRSTSRRRPQVQTAALVMPERRRAATIADARRPSVADRRAGAARADRPKPRRRRRARAAASPSCAAAERPTQARSPSRAQAVAMLDRKHAGRLDARRPDARRVAPRRGAR